MTNINYCRVRSCRFKTSHTTRGHLCGTCKTTGHGQWECYDYAEKEKLKNYFNEIIDPVDRCNIDDCSTRFFHKTSAHLCEYCQECGHSFLLCPNRIITVHCPICRTLNSIKANQKKVAGIDISCCICMDKSVQIFLPDCGHLCFCDDCYKKSAL